ncbi:MAG: cytochrome c3 family protein, partial [Deferrisomatales bacterium]
RGVASSPRHPPPDRGEACVACHPPHGGGARAAGSCRGCHPAATDRGHGLRLAECLGCHDPHVAPGGGLLSRSAQARCLACHAGVTPGPAAHPALSRGCERCHDPHREDDRTRAWGSCSGCHAPGLHGGLPMPAAACGTCHRPHAGRAAGLLRAPPHSPVARGRCAVCHGGGQDRSLVVRDPAARCRMCHAVEEDLRAPGVRAHAPAARGECTACHDPHLSDQPALLRVPGNGACLGCHPLAGHHPLDTRRAAQYPGAQGFPRAGDQFSCLGCHAPHGAAVPGLLVRPREELCRTCHPGRP